MVALIRVRLQNKEKTSPKWTGLFLAPEAGLEPATSKLTASCSTIELLRINYETNQGFSHRPVGKDELNKFNQAGLLFSEISGKLPTYSKLIRPEL